LDIFIGFGADHHLRFIFPLISGHVTAIETEV